MKDIGNASCVKFKEQTTEDDYLHFFAGICTFFGWLGVRKPNPKELDAPQLSVGINVALFGRRCLSTWTSRLNSQFIRPMANVIMQKCVELEIEIFNNFERKKLQNFLKDKNRKK